MNPSTPEGVFDFRGAELALLLGGAILTFSVLVISVLLYRHADKEHRAQLAREQQERESRKGGA